jgi:hypothetical protein
MTTPFHNLHLLKPSDFPDWRFDLTEIRKVVFKTPFQMGGTCPHKTPEPGDRGILCGYRVARWSGITYQSKIVFEKRVGSMNGKRLQCHLF